MLCAEAHFSSSLQVWNHFGTKLPQDTIIHIWLNKKTLADVVNSGYTGILSDNDAYYLPHLTVSVDLHDGAFRIVSQ